MGLSLWQRLKIRLGLAAYVGHRQMSGWRGPLPFYAFRCLKHGLVENYPSGYEQRLECPLCLAEARVKRLSPSTSAAASHPDP